MKVLLVTAPILRRASDNTSLTTIPPTGYGGIEAVLHTLIQGLIEHGHHITLIGSPGSLSSSNLRIIRDADNIVSIRNWVHKNYAKFDIVHDHSGGVISEDIDLLSDLPYLGTHHKTGVSPYPKNTVYLSNAQRNKANNDNAPVIRLPVILDDYLFNENKENYFLFLGRISPWKGVLEAAQFCKKLSTKLLIAGPSWEPEYLNQILDTSNGNVEHIGEVHGYKKIKLLSNAKALFVLSREIAGPWGDIWSEPGCTVVAEAGASGTPTISSQNGCLAEIITPSVGIQLDETEIANIDVSRIQNQLPSAHEVRDYTETNCNYIKISENYIQVYKKVISGKSW